MSQDIAGILDGWEYEPDGLQVRIITGDDGTKKIQMRIDLGLIQMELDGRPDGQRPHGFPSLLDYYEAKAKEALDGEGSFSLSSEDCALLMREGMQYYHRYLSAFHLERYDLVERDTDRNLRLFAFVARHAGRQRDKIEFDQYRPYVHMMRTRAARRHRFKKTSTGSHSNALTKESRPSAASLPTINRKRASKNAFELQSLIRWRREVEREQPMGPLEKLEQQLELSVELEDYEEAARIRDQIRRLQERSR